MADPSWFFASQGEQQGPYTEIQLAEFITKGAVTEDTLVWTEGMADWQRAGDVPGLLSNVRPPPPQYQEATRPGLPSAGHDTSQPKMAPGGKMQELEISIGRLARIYWLFAWRSFLGSVLIGFVLGFIIGLVLSALGGTADRIRTISAGVGLVGGLIWSIVCLKMALRKKYSDFRIVLVPRAAESN